MKTLETILKNPRFQTYNFSTTFWVLRTTIDTKNQKIYM